MRLLSTLLFFFMSINFLGQVDSLKRIKEFKSPFDKAVTYQEIAYSEGLSSIDSAIKYGDVAINIAKSIGEDSLVACVYNDRSIAYFVIGEYGNVLFNAKKSLEIREELGDSIGMAASYAKFGMAYQEMGSLLKATHHYLRALKIYQKENNQQKIAQLKNNLANIYERNNQLDEAFTFSKEAASAFLKLKDSVNYVVSMANNADVMMKQNKYDEAENQLLSLTKMAQKANYPDFLAQLYQSLGVLYATKGDLKNRILYYQRALVVYQNLESITGLSTIYGNLGHAYLDSGDIYEAENNLLLGLEYTERTNSYIEKKLVYGGLSRLYEIKGEEDKALTFYKKFQEAKDSIYNQNQQEELLMLQKRFEVEEKNRALAEKEVQLTKSELENKKKNFYIVISCLGILGMIILLFSIFKNFKDKKKEIIRTQELQAKEEKLRISRDLHDHIGAELTLIKSRIDKRVFLCKNEEEKTELQEISSYSKEAIDHLRKVIWATKNEYITLENFSGNLEKYMERFRWKVQLTNTANNLKLSSTIALNLFRTCQEIVNNAVKYSQGNAFFVSISEKEDYLSLTISDNGKGFDPSLKHEGNGIKNMQYRIKEIGGRINLTSSKEGTEYNILLKHE